MWDSVDSEMRPLNDFNDTTHQSVCNMSGDASEVRNQTLDDLHDIV